MWGKMYFLNVKNPPSCNTSKSVFLPPNLIQSLSPLLASLSSGGFEAVTHEKAYGAEEECRFLMTVARMLYPPPLFGADKLKA